jgi:hypothetical protein
VVGTVVGSAVVVVEKSVHVRKVVLDMLDIENVLEVSVVVASMFAQC